MTDTPLVSVILPVYNAVCTVLVAVESILSQTYSNIELIIVDDGSTDCTSSLLQRYYNHPKVTIVSQSNQGLTKSLLIGIKHASGYIIARQDADDISLPQRISAQVEALYRYDSDFVVCRAFSNQSCVVPRFSHLISPHLTLLHSNPFIHGTLLIKLQSLESVGSYNPDFPVSQDYDLFQRLISSNLRLTYLSRPFYYLNYSSSSISSVHSASQLAYKRAISRTYRRSFINSLLKTR